jgi:hypothetical protein
MFNYKLLLVIVEDAECSYRREDAERLPALGALPSVSARRLRLEKHKTCDNNTQHDGL